MPPTNMTCPHCEERFELPLASVIRSWACLGCGGMVFLQVSGSAKKRDALLMGREELSEDWPVAEFSLPYPPKALTKEEIDLQRKDPESRILLTKLLMGFCGVVLAIGALVYLEGDGVTEEEVTKEVEAILRQEVVKEEPKVEVVEVTEVKAVASDVPKGFEALFRERPTRPVVLRVWAKEGSSYGGMFGDSQWLRCVDLRAADDPKGRVLRAYVVRTSETGGAVDFRLRQGGLEAQQWTVQVRYPLDAEEPNQVWLDAVVADGWELARGQ
jgi:hypothetical protein